MADSLKWWQKAVFYQIYPRSFADGNDDGIGDFWGMVDRLDILQDLGVDAIWLSPHYPSPFVDCGYDISDYQDAAPEYGGMPEFKRFLEEVHKRGMRLILDLVLNHTSDQHRWFFESRSSRDNPKRDWYIWRKGKANQPPNNWYSTFGGSAWEYDPLTKEYYYHFFYKEQPDLNWKNPEVKAAMFDMVRFWLGLGVDGFRLDAIGTIFEEETYPDQPVRSTLPEMYRRSRLARSAEEQAEVAKDYEAMFQYQHDQPGVHELMKELRLLVDEYEDRVMVGETDDIAFYGNGSDELHLNFNFPLMRTSRMTPQHVQENQQMRLAQLPEAAWPCNTLGNHDSSRMLTAFGDGEHDEEIARVNLMMLLSIKGTPFLYNGEELGMSDVLIESLSDFVDPVGKYYYELEKEVIDSDEATAIRIAARGSRDKGRSPMQWSSAAHGGFCSAEIRPWLPVNPDYAHGVNYEEEHLQEDSMWNYYRSILAFRKGCRALIAGDMTFLSVNDENLLAFTRQTERETALILLNMGEEPVYFATSGFLPGQPAKQLATRRGKYTFQDQMVKLHGTSGVILLSEIEG